MNDHQVLDDARRTNGTDRDNAFAAVASLLWDERELLEHLLFKLTAEQLILRAGTVRWLAAADDEVRAALHHLRECEVLRAVEVHELATRLGVPAETTLRELADIATDPWGALLADHRETLRELVAEITATTAENRRMLQAGADAARETLGQVGQTTSIYGADGAAIGQPLGPILLDRQV